MIDVNKNKKHVGKREVNYSTPFLTQCQCYVITLKCGIFIFSPSKTKSSVIFISSQNKRKQTTSIFSTQQRFFRLFLLTAAKSSLPHWTNNFTILLTLLTSALAVWTSSWCSQDLTSMACCDLDLQNLIRSSVGASEDSLSAFIKTCQAVCEILWRRHNENCIDIRR